MTKTEIKPWWEYITNGNPNGYYEPIATFIQKALVLQGLEYGLPLVYNQLDSNSTFVDEEKSLGELEELLKSLGFREFYWEQKDRYKTFITNQGFISFGTNGEWLNYSTTDKELGYDLIKKFGHLFKQKTGDGHVYALIPGEGGLQTTSIGIGASPFIEENYTTEAITGYKQIVADLKSDDAIGRLSILTGCPGTGKTYLIRALLNECQEFKFLILSSSIVSDLSSPTLLKLLIEESECSNNNKYYRVPKTQKHANIPPTNNKPLVLVIEDADNCLTRKADSMASLSAILNATDGILGHLLNLRIICTTNAQIEEFDPAILRPGRLSARVEVGLLDIEQANKIYSRLGGEGIPDWGDEKFLPLSAVYAKVKGKSDIVETTKKPKNKIGFAA